MEHFTSPCWLSDLSFQSLHFTLLPETALGDRRPRRRHLCTGCSEHARWSRTGRCFRRGLGGTKDRWVAPGCPGSVGQEMEGKLFRAPFWVGRPKHTPLTSGKWERQGDCPSEIGARVQATLLQENECDQNQGARSRRCTEPDSGPNSL